MRTTDGESHLLASAPTADVSLITAECFGDTQPTFQGEGPSCGVPALFIRLSRCNLTCGWCDTKYTWDWQQFDPRKESTRRPVEHLIAWALASDVELVVVTGGEPLLQQPALIPLVRGLLDGGKRVEFETNGTMVPDPALLVDGVRFNVSPKLSNSGVATDKRIVPSALDAFAASGRAVFKFVSRTVAELDEIEALIDRYGASEGTGAPGQYRTSARSAQLWARPMRRATRRDHRHAGRRNGAPPRGPARATLVVPVHRRDVRDHGATSPRSSGRPGPPWSMTTAGRRAVSPSAIQRNCASSVIDVRPCVSIKVTAENLPVSLRLRQRLKSKLSATETRPRPDPGISPDATRGGPG
ncbi:7-carboxy-7-deazaguanine synthase QueE [Streptomyces sp. NPDC096176]|uniref:7-carboxy-7-deazaguanine synthase QueE n=1 Tax=Streptomyces sp. NPDC096176 TaxID=3366079 RepID=UPI00382C3D7D